MREKKKAQVETDLEMMRGQMKDVATRDCPPRNLLLWLEEEIRLVESQE